MNNLRLVVNNNVKKEKEIFFIKKELQTILIIVGFTYKKTGLLKYKVKPPNTEIIIPPIKGIYGIFFSTK